VGARAQKYFSLPDLPLLGGNFKLLDNRSVNNNKNQSQSGLYKKKSPFLKNYQGSLKKYYS